MMKREKRFIWSGGILFGISYWLLSNIMEAAKGVGDAPSDTNTHLRSIIYCLLIIACYAIAYYMLSYIINLNKRK